jgi:hypothetical protein
MSRASRALLLTLLLALGAAPMTGATTTPGPDARVGDLLSAIHAPTSDTLAHGIAVAEVASAQQADVLGLPHLAAPVAPRHAAPSEALLALAARHGEAPSGADLQRLRDLDARPEPLRGSLTRTVDAFLALEDATHAAFAHGGIDLAPVFPARAAFLDTLVPLRDAVGRPHALDPCTPLVVPAAFALDLAGCDDTYTDDVALQIDAGGNDTYLNNAGGGGHEVPRQPGVCHVPFIGDLLDVLVYPNYDPQVVDSTAALVDYGSGRDQHGDPATPRVCGVAGGGDEGVGLSVDEGGDDNYVGGNYGANGAGDYGAGFLLDADGNDTYLGADLGANGAGVRGTGLLVDMAGDDLYVGGNQGANGGGGWAGVGALIDAEGTDRYVAGREAANGGGSDAIFHLAGVPGPGVGLLLDADGNGDSYFDTTPACSGSGTDRTVVPKCTGFQIDWPAG